MFVRGAFLLHLQKHPCFSRLGRLAPEIPSVFDSVQQPFCFRPPQSSASGCILLNSRFRQNFRGQTRQRVGSGFGLGVSPALRKAPSAPAGLCRRPHSLAGFSGCRLVLPPLREARSKMPFSAATLKSDHRGGFSTSIADSIYSSATVGDSPILSVDNSIGNSSV